MLQALDDPFVTCSYARLIHVFDMTHSFIHSFIHVLDMTTCSWLRSWPIHIRDSFLYSTWLSHSYDIHVWRDSMICALQALDDSFVTHSYTRLIRVFDMTHSFVWHVMCDTTHWDLCYRHCTTRSWLIHMCDMTFWHVWLHWFLVWDKYVTHTHGSLTCVLQALDDSFVTYSYEWHDMLTCVTRLLFCAGYMCDTTHSFIWHDDSFVTLFVTRLLLCARYMCDTTHWCVRYGHCTTRLWLIHTRDMTHWHVWHDRLMCMLQALDNLFVTHSSTRHIHVCDTTHSFIWHDNSFVTSFVTHSSTSRIHLCDTTHSFIWHTCVTWLNDVCATGTGRLVRDRQTPQWDSTCAHFEAPLSSSPSFAVSCAFIHIIEACHTHQWGMSHTWLRYVTHMNEACDTHEWVIPRRSTRHVTQINEACDTEHSAVSHKWMSHTTHVWMHDGTHINASSHTYEWDTSHIWMSHVTHMNESCHTYEWVMSHIWMSHVTLVNAACHTHQGVLDQNWECKRVPKHKRQFVQVGSSFRTMSMSSRFVLHTYARIHAHIHTHTCIHTYIHTHARACTHTRTYAHAHTRTHTHTYIHIHIHMHTRLFTHSQHPHIIRRRCWC